MGEANDAGLSDLFDKLQFTLPERIDFTQTDPETTLAKVRHLSAVATYFNTLAITIFGGRAGPERAAGLVEQVIGAAFQTFAGVDPHPEAFDKAAMLLRGITQGHPFEDANKRTGFLVAAYYLRQMGYPFPEQFSTAEGYDLCVRISAGKLRDEATITQELQRLWGHK